MLILMNDKKEVLKFPTPGDKIYYKLPNGHISEVEAKEFIIFLMEKSAIDRDKFNKDILHDIHQAHIDSIHQMD